MLLACAVSRERWSHLELDLSRADLPSPPLTRRVMHHGSWSPSEVHAECERWAEAQGGRDHGPPRLSVSSRGAGSGAPGRGGRVAVGCGGVCGLPCALRSALGRPRRSRVRCDAPPARPRPGQRSGPGSRRPSRVRRVHGRAVPPVACAVRCAARRPLVLLLGSATPAALYVCARVSCTSSGLLLWSFRGIPVLPLEVFEAHCVALNRPNGRGHRGEAHVGRRRVAFSHGNAQRSAGVEGGSVCCCRPSWCWLRCRRVLRPRLRVAHIHRPCLLGASWCCCASGRGGGGSRTRGSGGCAARSTGGDMWPHGGRRGR